MFGTNKNKTMKTEFEKWKKDHPYYHDLTTGKGDVRNYYDPVSGDHYYNGFAWSKALWEVFINSNS